MDVSFRGSAVGDVINHPDVSTKVLSPPMLGAGHPRSRSVSVTRRHYRQCWVRRCQPWMRVDVQVLEREEHFVL